MGALVSLRDRVCEEASLELRKLVVRCFMAPAIDVVSLRWRLSRQVSWCPKYDNIMALPCMPAPLNQGKHETWSRLIDLEFERHCLQVNEQALLPAGAYRLSVEFYCWLRGTFRT